ncbi:Variant-specific surface protein [Giardia duodenalis]|uniref:Variant-specific surface protein n=1 Tax=Giardia intestinalis TaxID=5741 RepID=V6TNM9_GIAIN|nr:Variant-specific surface protein [Giardia intestinalis]
MLNTFTLASLLAQLFLAALSSEETCTTGTGSTNCADNMCNVWIGGQKYCSQCATKATEFPINGKCTSSNDDNGKICTAPSQADGTCASCANGYFLHKGGCYKIGQAPGNAICTDAQASGTVGECKTCATGYFKNPTAVGAAVPPCIACNDTTGNSGNKGIDKCSTCTIESSPNTGQTAKCTKCIAPNYLKTSNSGTECVASAEACTPKTEFGKVDETNGNKCVSCSDVADGVTDCAECTAPAQGKTKPTCTKCSAKYLKTTTDGTTTCVEKTACKDDFFPVDDPTNGNKCISCGDETSGVPNCVKCTAPSSAGGKPTCSECGSGYKLEGGACVPTNTNKSSLSTGAIAGISVAVIVIVGGLVGFLCWWFVCRGKA